MLLFFHFYISTPCPLGHPRRNGTLRQWLTVMNVLWIIVIMFYSHTIAYKKNKQTTFHVQRSCNTPLCFLNNVTSKMSFPVPYAFSHQCWYLHAMSVKHYWTPFDVYIIIGNMYNSVKWGSVQKLNICLQTINLPSACTKLQYMCMWQHETASSDN